MPDVLVIRGASPDDDTGAPDQTGDLAIAGGRSIRGA